MKRKTGEGTVTRRKDGRFEAALFVKTPDGTKRRVRRYTATRSEADALLVELRKKHNSGMLINTREQQLGDYLDYWLTIVKRTSRPNTYTSYESIVRNYLKPGLGGKCLTKLSVSEVQTHLDKQLETGLSTRTAQKQKMVLSAALQRAAHEELVIRNVARLVKLPAYKPKEIVPWDVKQLQTFLNQADPDPFYPIFVILSLYGLRESEALGLSWRDIDFERNVIHVRQQLQRHEGAYYYAALKTHAGRRELPLVDTARKILKQVERTNCGPLPDLVFKTSAGNPIDGGILLDAFKRISTSAGLPIINLHHLRHTAATNLKNIGVPARDTQLILGHAHITTTQQIYQHADKEGQYVAIERYEQQIVSVSMRSRQMQPSSDIIAPKIIENNSGAPGTVSFEHLLAWLDQFRLALESGDDEL
jgi:integrase